MRPRQSNAGEAIATAHFTTTVEDEMRAYDALPTELRRQIDQCVHEFSALQVTQMMQEQGLSPEQMAARFWRYSKTAIEKQRNEL